MDYSQPNLPLAPPPAPPTVSKRSPRVALIAVIAVLGIVAAALVVLLLAWDSSADTSTHRAGPTHTRSVETHSPAATDSPAPTRSPAIDKAADRGARINGIVSEAESGRYFSNAYGESYPAAFERGIVKGMTLSPASKMMSDEFLACMLSYIESNASADEIVSDRDLVQTLGRRAAINCIKLGVS